MTTVSINLTVLEMLEDADLAAGAHEGTAGIQSALGPEGRRSGLAHKPVPMPTLSWTQRITEIRLPI